MTQQEIVDFMLNSLNEDNRTFAKQAGMDDAQIEENLAKSQETLAFMMQNIYSKLVQKGLIDLSKVDIS
jgi:uncharacterized protein YfkK (UPF0435 family)